MKRLRVAGGAALCSVLLALGLAGCHPDGVHITVANLFPTFQTAVIDYVNRCDPATDTQVQVQAPDGFTVSVDGQPAQSGNFTATVDQQVGERFTIVVTSSSTTRTHHVRCLPQDFPAWQVERTGTPQAQFYSQVMVEGFFGPGNYSAIYDTNGVPVWWLHREPTFLFQRLANGNFATMNTGGGMKEWNLRGELVRTLNTVGANSDFHDVQLLPNGNYLMATASQEPCNLSSWRADLVATICINHEFQELTTLGVPVKIWDTAEHIPPTETTPNWIDAELNESGPFATPGVYDPWHYNSLEWTGDGVIISFRHLDAVYKVDWATGDIVWKLSGTPRPPDSLRLVGDALDGVRGQHDARLIADGTVTIYDNGTLGRGPNRAPRSVGYFVDEEEMTATLVDDVRDPDVANSGCCGSTRLLPRGNWVTGWGGTNQIGEYRPDGTQVFRLNAGFTYRGLPILPGQYRLSAIRAGMDAQFAAANP